MYIISTNPSYPSYTAISLYPCLPYIFLQNILKFISVIFILWPTGFPHGNLITSFGGNHWSLVGSAVATEPKTMTLPFLLSFHSQYLFRKGESPKAG